MSHKTVRRLQEKPFVEMKWRQCERQQQELRQQQQKIQENEIQPVNTLGRSNISSDIMQIATEESNCFSWKIKYEHQVKLNVDLQCRIELLEKYLGDLQTTEEYERQAEQLKDQLWKNDQMECEISELNRRNELLQTTIEDLKSVNNQFSTVSLDIETQIYDFKTKNMSLKKRNTKMQSTVTDLIKKNSKMWSHLSDIQGSITHLKTTADKVKGDNSQLQLEVHKLNVKNEQLQGMILELRGNISQLETSVREKDCELEAAGTQNKDLQLRVLNLQEQNEQLKNIMLDVEKKQDYQQSFNKQMQDNVSQVRDVAEKLHIENKQMQAVISELGEKKYQLEVFVSALEENNCKLQAALPSQRTTVSELQDNDAQEKLQHENWKMQATISELHENKYQMEDALAALKEKLFQLEMTQSDNKRLQFTILELQAKHNDCITSIAKLDDKNIILQKNYNGLQDYKNELLTTLLELQGKMFKLESYELQNRQFQMVVMELQESNAQLEAKISRLQEKNNSLEDYISQLQGTRTKYQPSITKLQVLQSNAGGVDKTKYQFEDSLSELQATLCNLEVSETTNERLQESVSELQEKSFEVQDAILKLRGRINSLYKSIMELQEYSHQFSFSVSELQDKNHKYEMSELQNPPLLQTSKKKECHREQNTSLPELETLVEASKFRIFASRRNVLPVGMQNLIEVSNEIKISIQCIETDVRNLQSSSFELENKFNEIQSHKDNLLKTEACSLRDIVKQMKEYNCLLEMHEDEKAKLKQEISDLENKLAEEKCFSSKTEDQMQSQQRIANSENSKLQETIKDLQCNNTRLEETISWSLERNGVLDVKLATLKNILEEEQLHSSEKEAKINQQWKTYINQIDNLQGMLSEMFTENTDLKETVKNLEQEKVLLQTTITELVSKVKSEIPEVSNVGIQVDCQTTAEFSEKDTQKTHGKMWKGNSVLPRDLEKHEPPSEKTVNNLLGNKKVYFDEERIDDHTQKIADALYNCSDATTEELLVKDTKICKVLTHDEKKDKTADFVNCEVQGKLTDAELHCNLNEYVAAPSQSTIAGFKNSHPMERSKGLVESNKRLHLYIENLMAEKCLLTAIVSELETRARKVKEHCDDVSEIENAYCEDIPSLASQEADCKQQLDYNKVSMFNDEEKALLEAIIFELEKKVAKDEFHASELEVQLETQRKEYDAEKRESQKKAIEAQEDNEKLKAAIRKYEEEKKWFEIRLAEQGRVLAVEQSHICEMESELKHQIEVLRHKKCQLEDMVGDLLDENKTLKVIVDKSWLHPTKEEKGSKVKNHKCFSGQEAVSDIEPADQICDFSKLQRIIKKLEERSKRLQLIVERYKIDKDSLTEALSKFKHLLEEQQIHCRERMADLSKLLKTADAKIQQLQTKLTELTPNYTKLQEIIDKAEREKSPSQVTVSNTEKQLMPLNPGCHRDHNISQEMSEYLLPVSSENLEISVQTLDANNERKSVDFNTQQQASNESLMIALHAIEREKNMLELNMTDIECILEYEQLNFSKLESYLTSKYKVAKDPDSDLQKMLTELLDDNTRYQVSIDALEKEKRLLKDSLTELEAEMKRKCQTCIDKAVQKDDEPKDFPDIANQLKEPEVREMNLQATIPPLERDEKLFEMIDSHPQQEFDCLSCQLKDLTNENNSPDKASEELVNNIPKCQEIQVYRESNKKSLTDAVTEVQDRVNVECKSSKNKVPLKDSHPMPSAPTCLYGTITKPLDSNNPLQLSIENHTAEEVRISLLNHQSEKEKMVLIKTLLELELQGDVSHGPQKTENTDATEISSGEIDVLEFPIFKMEEIFPGDHPPYREAEALDSTHMYEIINELQNIVPESHRQAIEQKDVSIPELRNTASEDYSSKVNPQFNSHWNTADAKLRNNCRQGTDDELHCNKIKHQEILQNTEKQSSETELQVKAAETEIQNTTEEIEIQDTVVETEIQDTAGETEIQDTAAETEIQDTAAETEIQDTAGENEIQDTAGETEIQDTAGETEIQDTIEETEIQNTAGETEIRDKTGEKVTLRCAGVSPLLFTEDTHLQGIAAEQMWAFQTLTAITPNHQEQEPQNITFSDPEMEGSMDQFRDLSHTQQSLFADAVKVSSERTESISCGTLTLSENSKLQESWQITKQVAKKQDIAMVLEMKCTQIEEDKCELGSLMSGEISAQEEAGTQNNTFIRPIWEKCMLQ
eukprot:gi/632974710/ref/XP_007903828.1/ PREDICTED: putative leucine-rich repeat-containing protein DDB_G0290503 [Callorhinchus milii]